MTVFVTLLRAINVGGTGKLAMRDLIHFCESAGFRHVRTYIASGNVVFESDLTEADWQGHQRSAPQTPATTRSRTQGLLSQGGSDTVEVGALVRAELAAHVDGAEDRLTASGPTVYLRARQLQNFALALHELTTNAVKYGALKSDTGRLATSWDVVLDQRERRRLALNWVKSGVAIEPEKITRRGYGTELIQEALAYALEATVNYALAPGGVRCRIEMPLA